MPELYARQKISIELESGSTDSSWKERSEVRSLRTLGVNVRVVLCICFLETWLLFLQYLSIIFH